MLLCFWAVKSLSFFVLPHFSCLSSRSQTRGGREEQSNVTENRFLVFPMGHHHTHLSSSPVCVPCALAPPCSPVCVLHPPFPVLPAQFLGLVLYGMHGLLHQTGARALKYHPPRSRPPPCTPTHHRSPFHSSTAHHYLKNE